MFRWPTPSELYPVAIGYFERLRVAWEGPKGILQKKASLQGGSSLRQISFTEVIVNRHDVKSPLWRADI